MEKFKVSVAMATYNGEKYIKEQIDSILMNLKEDDELIISDDGSTDDTLKIVNEFNDSRIKMINGLQQGVKKNFENAIKNTTGDIIFLADQDDIWCEKKVENVVKIFSEKKDISLVIHDAKVFNSEDEMILYDSFFEYRNSGRGIIKNIYKNTYIGCCIAFHRDLIKYILPIPDNVEMHDQWIGIINEIFLKKSFFLSNKLIKYRRHMDNVSSMEHYPIKKMIKNRLNFVFALVMKIIRR